LMKFDQYRIFLVTLTVEGRCLSRSYVSPRFSLAEELPWTHLPWV